MERILKGWNFIRLIRLVFGIWIGVQAILQQEWMLGFAGIFFAGTALFNVGCCGVNSCQPLVKANPGQTKEIIYEEVDAQK
jgi:hypothetical protein